MSKENESNKLENLYKEKGKLITDIELFQIRLNKINQEIGNLLKITNDKN